MFINIFYILAIELFGKIRANPTTASGSLAKKISENKINIFKRIFNICVIFLELDIRHEDYKYFCDIYPDDIFKSYQEVHMNFSLSLLMPFFIHSFIRKIYTAKFSFDIFQNS